MEGLLSTGPTPSSFYSEAYISLNISIECLQRSCVYQLRVKYVPHDFWIGLAFVELVKTHFETGQIFF